MKTFEFLKKTIEIIQKNLNIAIYNTFSSKSIKLPIEEKFLTIEIFSGSENKTIITITAYAPMAQGAKACQDLTKKTMEILTSSKIENLNEVAMQNITLDKSKQAFLQKCTVTFKLPKEKKTAIYFGNEEIFAKEDLTLKFSRNVSIYHSQISGIHFRDLGRALRKVCGTAIVQNDQFQRLCDIISNGTTNTLKVEGQTFKAILTSLEKKTKNEMYFSFLEVA